MSRKHLFFIIYLFLTGVVFVSGVGAVNFATILERDPEAFFIYDYAIFKSDTLGSLRLEVYYQIYNPALNFFREDSLYIADYEITVDVFGKGRKVGSYRQVKQVVLEDKFKVSSALDYRTNQVNFDLPPGKYEVKINLKDPHSLTNLKRKFKVKLKDFYNKYPSLSEIELVQMVERKTEYPTVFDKGELLMVPSVSHIYGKNDSDNMKLYFYMEIYDGKDDYEEVRIETVLRHYTKGMVYRDSLTTSFTDDKIRQFREITLDEFPAGEYELIITVKGKRNKKLAVKYKDFTLFWTYQSMIKHDFNSIIKQLSLIASNDEIKALKDAETLEERKQAFSDFWTGRDPTPGTSENEFKTEFYSRVAIADKFFSFLNHHGWQTDRGRIFIKYGVPDQIDDFPLMPNNHPYQEWHYYHSQRYLKFVFVDENEDGDYRLIYPYDGVQ